MKINVSLLGIEEREIIDKGLNSYLYIQDHYQENSDSFKSVYYNFYLKAQPLIRVKENRDKYFDLLKQCKPTDNLIDIVLKTYEVFGKYEFSFATKMLHTKNTSSPIFDSKVYNYLKKEEGVDFWNIHYNKKGTTIIDRIKHNWDALNDWYDAFLKTKRAREWITYFDAAFFYAKDISDIKKIDFIIFACSDKAIKKDDDRKLLEYTVLDIIEEINYCLEKKKYYVALSTTLTLPSICSKMQEPENKNEKERYPRWCNKWFPPEMGKINPMLIEENKHTGSWGHIIYALRNGITHAGENGIKESNYTFIKLECFEFYIGDKDGCVMHFNSNRYSGVFSSIKDTLKIRVNINAFINALEVAVQNFYSSFIKENKVLNKFAIYKE